MTAGATSLSPPVFRDDVPCVFKVCDQMFIFASHQSITHCIHYNSFNMFSGKVCLASEKGVDPCGAAPSLN
jgi:hypothetical protein